MTWKIVVEPHKKTGGVVVKTVAAMDDRRAEKIAQAVEAAVSKLSKAR